MQSGKLSIKIRKKYESKDAILGEIYNLIEYITCYSKQNYLSKRSLVRYGVKCLCELKVNCIDAVTFIKKRSQFFGDL